MDTKGRILENKYRVAVLCGGESSEREVSLVSGRAVAEAFSSLHIPCDLFELERNRVPSGLFRDTHLVLPVVHGTYGEDGRLSAELEYLGYAYAGCDQASSVICFDKLACKAISARLGIPVARDIHLPAGDIPDHGELEKTLGTPFILKPRRDGSSVGLYLVRDASGYRAARADMERADYLAEEYLDGCDLTVGLLGGKALGVVAVHPEGGLYDYRHKYTSGLSRYDVPANIPEGTRAELGNWSEQLFAACGCRDLARADYRMAPDGRLVFLEVNTLPGMTPTSLLPKAAQCAGIPFEQLVLEWAGFALRRLEGPA
ncbi:MAG: D-alanine--D-alanine ligase family protein [Oceanipulchritudo sp.]